jgi:uncharacterized membrane protein YhhN
MHRHHRWLGAFALAAFTEISASIFGHSDMAAIAKSLLMPLLAIWFYFDTRNVPGALRYWYLGALFFSLLGDVLLIFARGPEGGAFFVRGLAAFLLTHVLLIVVFNRLPHRAGPAYLRQHGHWLGAYLLYVVVFLWVLQPKVPAALLGPIGAYALTIAGMSLSVLNLRGRIAADAWKMLFFGSLLFILSDSMIAIHRFVAPFEGAGIAIMGTYIVAQWLIASGVSAVLRG